MTQSMAPLKGQKPKGISGDKLARLVCRGYLPITTLVGYQFSQDLLPALSQQFSYGKVVAKQKIGLCSLQARRPYYSTTG